MSLENQLRPQDLKAALTHCIHIKDPVFVWGPPGAGKSQIMAQLAKEQYYVFIDVRMSQMDAIDLRGMPMIPKEHADKKAVMIWALPEFLPQDPDTKAVIFFDEMNHAIPTNLSAAYQLIQERRLGTYNLPEQVVCMAAGNRKGDYGSDFDLPAPLADRFTHLELKVNAADWLDWALRNFVHPHVVGFIGFKNEYLTQYDELGKSLTFATPRSWAKVGEHLDAGLSRTVLQALVAGRVGNGIAIEFLAYCEKADMLPNPVDVLTGKVTTMTTKKADLVYSMVVSLTYTLKEFFDAFEAGELSANDYNTIANNFLKFSSENFTKTEMLIMAVRTALTTYKVLFDTANMPYFDEFLNVHGDALTKYLRSN